MTQDKKLLIPSKWEYVVPALAIVSLLISCVLVSSKKFFWNDELYSYYFLADPSFTHMLAAFHDKINNTPPLYFLMGWLWARGFGSTELSLRLFSSLGMCLACIVVWIVLRRTYNFWSASIGVLSIFCTSSLILSQNAEARMYGLFLLVCSLALLLYDSINRNQNNNWNTLLLNTCIHAAIVNTHIFGLFYSGAIAVSLIVRDKYFNLFRPKVYFSIFLGWLFLILYIPSFINQADAGNPRTWIPIPTVRDLIDVLSFSLLSFQPITVGALLKITILLLLVFISGLQLLVYKNDNTVTSKLDKQNRQNSDSKISLLLFAYVFLAVPIFFWMISRSVKPIFWDRYLLPSILSWPILLAYSSSFIPFISNLSKKNFKHIKIFSLFVNKQKELLLPWIIVILLIQPIRYAANVSSQQLPGLNDNRYGYRELPIAVPFSHDFLERFHYSSERDRYFFILDWQVALDATSGLIAPQLYKHFEAWKRNYPNLFQDHIINSEDFLSRYKRFLILTFIDYNTKKCTLERKLINGYCPRWIEMRITNNHIYKVTSLGEIDNRKLLLVETQE